MASPTDEARCQHPAPCRGARRLLVVIMVVSLLATLATVVGLWLQGPRHDNTADAWMNALTLSAPALWTAGSPMRHPETVHPAVDLRFCAGLEATP